MPGRARAQREWKPRKWGSRAIPRRENHENSRALAQSAVHSYRAPQKFAEPLDCRQTKPGAQRFHFSCLFVTVVFSEYMRQGTWLDTNSSVAYRHAKVRRCHFASQLDIASMGITHGVAEKILHNSRQFNAVGEDGSFVGELEVQTEALSPHSASRSFAHPIRRRRRDNGARVTCRAHPRRRGRQCRSGYPI